MTLPREGEPKVLDYAWQVRFQTPLERCQWRYRVWRVNWSPRLSRAKTFQPLDCALAAKWSVH